MGKRKKDEELPPTHIAGKAFSLFTELLAELHEEYEESFYSEGEELHYPGYTGRVEPEHIPVLSEAIFMGSLFDSPVILFDYNRFYL